LGDISKEQETKIIDGMWTNIGRTFAEYVYLKDFKFNKTNFPHMTIKGVKYLEEIKKNNQPVIFYSGHFANFELMAMELDKFGIKCAAIYRPLNNFFLNPLMEYLRMKYICPNQIPKGRIGMREIVGKIKNGYSVALMVDQRVSEGPRELFFNKPAHTTTIPAQLALKYGCKLVPIYLERKEDIKFELTIHEPYEFEKTGNDKEDTKSITIKINKILEKMVIKNPKQWIWSHNRWK
jgi:KDO2-lipid IV(A) lauroyltransferase